MAGASSLPDCSTEEVSTLLDADQRQRSWKLHQIRTASVIRFLIPVALVVCAVVGTARVVPLPTTKNHLRVIEELELDKGDIETYFSTGMDRLGGVPNDLSEQVDILRKEAKKARDKLQNWTDHQVEESKKKVEEYVSGLAVAADELENAESELVGMCGTTAELLVSIGEELERKIATAESKRTHQDLADEQTLMRETIKFTAKRLEKIKGHFQSAKKQFSKLAVVSAELAMAANNSMKELNASVDHSVDQNKNIAILVGSTLVACGATVASVGVLIPLCLAATGATGGALMDTFHKNFDVLRESIQALKESASHFTKLMGRCDSLRGKAQADIDELTKVQINVDAQKLRMHVSSIFIWKHTILPKNKKLVKQLKNVVSSYKNN